MCIQSDMLQTGLVLTTTVTTKLRYWQRKWNSLKWNSLLKKIKTTTSVACFMFLNSVRDKRGILKHNRLPVVFILITFFFEQNLLTRLLF